MNKNSKSRWRIALKNYHRGQNETSFLILATMPNSRQLGERKQTITIGNGKRKNKNPKVAGKRFNQTSSNQD